MVQHANVARTVEQSEKSQTFNIDDSRTARFARGVFVVPQRDALLRVSNDASADTEMASEASHLQL